MARKDIKEVIELPEGFNTEIEWDKIKISGGSKSVERRLEFPAKKVGDKIIIEQEKATKKEKRLIKSLAAHLRNIILGLGKKFVYKLQICSVHFPMNVSVKEQELVIKNFLGEVKDRKAKILQDVEVKIEKDIIMVESHDKEKAGQTSANIERATKISKRDRRVFQDGIYLIKKCKGRRR